MIKVCVRNTKLLGSDYGQGRIRVRAKLGLVSGLQCDPNTIRNDTPNTNYNRQRFVDLQGYSLAFYRLPISFSIWCQLYF